MATSPQPAPPSAATPEDLERVLAEKPVLWVGAGASVAAGYPGTGALVAAMVQEAGGGLDPAAAFPQVADAFVAARSEGALSTLLQRLIAPPHPPTALHGALARLAGAGCFATVVTTNYDDLLERALSAAGVPYVLQHLEGNLHLEIPGHVPLWKLHGSRDDWLRVVLSGRSYEAFEGRYPFLAERLEVLLRTHPVLFVGCSLQDPRLLAWLAKLSEEGARALHPWRALMKEDEWRAALATPWQGGTAGAMLDRAPLRPLVLAGHERLPGLWVDVAARLAPEARWLALEVKVGEPWRAWLEGCTEWQPADPLADPELAADLARLRDLSRVALPTTEAGFLAAEAAGAAAELRALAASVGGRLTEALLSPQGQARLATAVRAGRAGAVPLLHLRVRAAGPGEAAERRADRVLALPWELLWIEERFPVEDGALDLAREAVVEELPGLAEPDRPLAVVATAAAPIDAGPLDHEEEMFRLWRAVGERAGERRLLVTDSGGVDDLVRAVARHRPPVVHFTGHGRPGELLFEDKAARARPVAAGELVKRLGEVGFLPRLFYLSACYGAAVEAASVEGEGERLIDPAIAPTMVEGAAMSGTPPSTAAALHRAGFTQVVAFFGPVGDRQATRAAAEFYAGLTAGRTVWAALRAARRLSSEPLRGKRRAHSLYPLGWAQLAFYHRGGQRATALPAGSGAAVDLAAEERRRVFERLDREGGSKRVEGIQGVQRLRFGFVGRRAERAEAIRRWQAGVRVLVVQGLGGLGKTALCAEVAPILAEALGEKTRVLALDGRFAGSQADPVAALWREVQAARKDDAWSATLAGLQGGGLRGVALARALLALKEKEGSLLVYLDDAESLQAPLAEKDLGRWRNEGFARFWEVLTVAAVPGGTLGVLASSRYVPAETTGEAVVPLPPMRPYEVVRLLSWMPTLGGMPAEDREWVAGQVDGHPRTVEYLEVLARKGVERLAPLGGTYRGGDWRGAVLPPVLTLAREKVGADLLLGEVWEALGEEAQEHLGRCSALAEPAPWEAVVDLQPAEGTARELAEAGMLSPFQPPLETDLWWAPHRLVAEEARRRWRGDLKETHRRLGRWFRERFEAEGLQVWARRSVDHLLAAGEPDHAWPVTKLIVLNLKAAGRYKEALPWVERVLRAGPTGWRLGLALTFQAQLGRLADALPDRAEESLLQALDLVGEEDRAFVLSELGSLCARQGRLREAAGYLGQAVAVEIGVKGEEHPDIAAYLHELAGVLQAQGDLPAARRHLERSLQIQAAVFGTEEHPSVAASLHALARVLKAQGDLPAARRHLERSLQIKAAVFGTEEHPSVATSLHALAGVLQAQGDLPAARRHLERSLQIQAAVFGTEEHPDVAASLHELAGVLQAQGDLPAARRHLERSLQIKAAVFGTEEHPSVAASLHALAGVLQAQGDLPGARQHLERVLAIEAKVYGTRDHYSTAITEMVLGFLLQKLGEKEKAVELLAHAYAVFRRQLGPDHPYTRQLAPLFEERPGSS